MAILVVGSVAYDGIETPAGKVDRCLGGAATYFSLAASFFTEVRVIAVVGEDFSAADESVLTSRGIDTAGIEHAAGKSFFWRGKYENVNEAITLDTQLNLFAGFSPKLPEQYSDSEFLFLANIDPVLQAQVRAQMPKVKLVCGDTMNYWIQSQRAALENMLRGLDVLIINDGEAKMLADENNLVRAASKILELGPKTLIVKHGEFGATAFFGDGSFASSGARHGHISLPFRAPALPLAEVVDPTGAGDSFAGGFFGYLASQPELTPASFRNAMFYGGVLGSFAVERFGTERLQQLPREENDARFNLFRQLTHLDAA